MTLKELWKKITGKETIPPKSVARVAPPSEKGSGGGGKKGDNGVEIAKDKNAEPVPPVDLSRKTREDAVKAFLDDLDGWYLSRIVRGEGLAPSFSRRIAAINTDPQKKFPLEALQKAVAEEKNEEDIFFRVYYDRRCGLLAFLHESRGYRYQFSEGRATHNVETRFRNETDFWHRFRFRHLQPKTFARIARSILIWLGKEAEQRASESASECFLRIYGDKDGINESVKRWYSPSERKN